MTHNDLLISGKDPREINKPGFNDIFIGFMYKYDSNITPFIVYSFLTISSFFLFQPGPFGSKLRHAINRICFL